MRQRPGDATELLLATCIDDDPTDDFSSSGYNDEKLGLAFDNNGYPTFYTKSPLYSFLRIDPEVALTLLNRLTAFCMDRWVANWVARHGRSPAALVLRLPDGTEHPFFGNREVFGWSRTDSHHTSQAHSAMAALEHWLYEQVDAGQATPYLERLLAESNCAGVLGVLINVGKRTPSLFQQTLRPLLGTETLYWWDVDRVKHRNYVDIAAWARQGEYAFQLAQTWRNAPHLEKNLLDCAVQLLLMDSQFNGFLADATATWILPGSEKASLESDLLKAQLDARNYSQLPGSTGYQFNRPGPLQERVQKYERDHASSVRLALLPSQCEQLLSDGNSLADANSVVLASVIAMDSHDSSHDSIDSEDLSLARVAASATLIVLAGSWLSKNPEVATRAMDVLDEALEREHETRRSESTWQLRKALEYAAQAVATNLLDELEQPDLDQARSRRLMTALTSGNSNAVKIIADVFVRRGQRFTALWDRLLTIGLLWAALSALHPRFGAPVEEKARWNRWLHRLRALQIPSGTAITAGPTPLALAQRTARFELRRWRKTASSGEARPKLAYVAGLDNEVTCNLFDWLLEERAAGLHPTHEDLSERRGWLEKLTALELWAPAHDEDDASPPSKLGYALAGAVAHVTALSAADESRVLWQPILALGGREHYLVQHFINHWQLILGKSESLASLAPHWRSMLEFVLDAPTTWTGRNWYNSESMLCSLLGFGALTLESNPSIQPVISSMSDLYTRWSVSHLAFEDNVSRFSSFLSRPTGKPLRLQGVKWLSNALADPKSHWTRTETKEALLELVNVLLLEDADAIKADADSRESVIHLMGWLVQRQVPAAMALQERALVALRNI